jgi:hypothetical protein
MSGIIKIGNCYSGLLYEPKTAPQNQGQLLYRYPRVIQRLALATERAFNDLGRNFRLLKKLDDGIEKGQIPSDPLRLALYVPKFYQGRQDWATFGIRYFDPPEQEYGDYHQAEKMVLSMEKGVNRKLLLAIQGVRAIGVEELPEEIFGKLLYRVANHYQDPSFDGINYIRVAKVPFDSIETLEDGNKGIVMSIRLIELEDSQNQISFRSLTFPIPINPDGTPIKGK